MTIKLTPFDASKYLDNEETISVYLTEALESGDDDVFLAALGDVIKARGMAAVAGQAGVGRESLYKTLTPGSKPRLETVFKLLHALGIRLIAAPEPAHA